MKTTFNAYQYSLYVRKAAETKVGLESLEISHEAKQHGLPMAGNSGAAPPPNPGCQAVPIEHDILNRE